MQGLRPLSDDPGIKIWRWEGEEHEKLEGKYRSDGRNAESGCQPLSAARKGRVLAIAGRSKKTLDEAAKRLANACWLCRRRAKLTDVDMLYAESRRNFED